MTDSHISRG